MAMGEGRAHVLDCLPHRIWYLPPPYFDHAGFRNWKA
eukprot:SAG22_NODE_4686_length_1192_cov_1.667887_2_plen_36_part_01